MKRIHAGMRGLFCLLSTVLLLHCLQAKAQAFPGVSTDKSTYLPGEEIRVNFSGAPGAGGDWICIVRSGAPDTDGGDYQYIPTGAERGYLTFTAPGPGRYEVRAYYNYHRNGYVVSARNSFSVLNQWSSGGVEPRHEHFEAHGLLDTDKTTYLPGEPIRVHFSEAPGDSGDWICIVRSGAPDNYGGDYQYIPTGAERGYMTFTAHGPGTYEVRAYYHYHRNGYVVSARHVFYVAGRQQYSTEESNGPDPMLRQAQARLQEQGYDPGDADGYYGRKTRRAIRDFQRDNHLQETGRLDHRTRKALGLLDEPLDR